MSRNSTVSRWLFVTDVDDTLVGDDDSLANLASELELKREEIIFTFNSSRPCASVRRTIQDNTLIPLPDFLIGALGTEIENHEGQLLEGYSERLDSGWDRQRIATLMEQIGFQAHPDEFQTPFKASYSIKGPDQYQDALDLLSDKGMDVKVIFSGRSNLDFIPKTAGKGAAIQYLRDTLDVSPDRVVTAGDSRNDLDMFAYPNKVIVVSNAETEIRSLRGEHIFQARAPYAAGVLEGLHFWGVL
jgi:sucrose-6-phosphatase